MLVSWLLTASLAAPPLTVDTARAAAEALRAPLSEAAGRPLASMPDLSVTSVATFEARARDRLLRQLLETGVPRELAVERVMADRPAWTVSPMQVMAYTREDRRVWVLDERLAALSVTEDGAENPHAERMLSCYLAHELVHALQDQEGVLDRIDAGEPASLALIEGQAELLGRAACDAPPAWQGLDRASTTLLDPFHPETSDTAILYGLAPEWISGWLAGRPLSASWALFDETPPDLSALIAPVGDHTKAALDELARSLAGEDSVEGLPYRSIHKLSWKSWSQRGWEALARAVGFRSARWRIADGGAVGAAMVFFEDKSAAADFSAAVCLSWAAVRGTFIHIRDDPDTQQTVRRAYTLWRHPFAPAWLTGASSACGLAGPTTDDPGQDGQRRPGLHLAIAAYGDRVVFVEAPFLVRRHLALARAMAGAARRTMEVSNLPEP